MIVFTIYYKKDTGEIVSYLEGGALPPEDEIPDGCGRICYDRVVKLSDPPRWAINVKVDLTTLQLVPINPPNILTPEAMEAANQVTAAADPNGEIRHV